ncbi:LysR family transcriptional regulator [Paenibacillus sp. CN-4]|uniref:LysR family transcriptional regulator n=1 Tax=Paenibacillus nanchangensis TaxID=3348343 RepID=UPI0039783981
MSLSLEWYRVFYWTAKLGGVTNAAKKLHITQPAVSHTLKQLESSLGGNLFFRSPKGVTLTSEGEVLFQFVEQAIQLIDQGETKLIEMQNLVSGEINIGASDTLCKHYLLPYLEQFHKDYPDVRVRVTNRTTPETIALLKEGIIDFGVVNLPAEDPKIQFKKSLVQQDCLIGIPRFADLLGESTTLGELQKYPLLMLETGGSTRSYLDNYALSHGVIFNPDFELGSIDLLVEFALSGFGLALIVRDYVHKELASGKLVEIPIAPAIPERHIGIAVLKGVPLSKVSERFLDKIIPFID